MSHLDEGTLHAYLDGELGPVDVQRVRGHVESCAPCAGALAEAEEAVRGVREVLETGGLPDAPAAHRWEIRRRWARRRMALGRRRVAAAAAVLLFLGAGLASAHPASPVREWLSERWSQVAGGGDDAADATVAGAREGRRAVGADLRDGAILVDLVSAPPDTRVEARVVDGARASLEVAGDARFETGPGRLAAEVRSGDVLIELPEDAVRAEVRTERGTLLLLEGGVLAFPGAAPEEATPGGARFRLPGGDR